MTTSQKILAGLTTAILFSSCYYDKEEILYPAGNCNSTGSIYSGTVSVILTAKCYSCHSTAAAPASGNNIVLDNYAGVKTQVTNGKLLGSINHAAGYSPMPKGNAKLSSCEIAKISNWIGSGAPNN